MELKYKGFYVKNNYNRDDFKESVVKIKKVTKVVKGGRRFRFTALVVVGNKNGSVGYGIGKAKEVVDAISKAIDDAFNNVVTVNIKVILLHMILKKNIMQVELF